MEQPRQFTIVKVDDDEFHLLTADGRFAAKLTAVEVEHLERAQANPLPLDP